MCRIFFALLLSCFATVSIAQSDTVWIDVRTPEEFQQGHLQGAINLPHDNIRQEIGSLDIAKSTPIVVYCRSGRRAGLARQQLEELGYESVVNAVNQEQAEVLKKERAAAADKVAPAD